MFDQNSFNFDSSVMGNNNVVDNDMNVDINMNSEASGINMNMGSSCGCPIQEGVQQKCIHKTIVHEVPQE